MKGRKGKWFVRWVAGAPVRWLGRHSPVGQDLTGGRHGLEYLRHLARGNQIADEPPAHLAETDAPPVLLIHGFLGTRGSMYVLERRLVEDGFRVFSFNLGSLNIRDIRRSAFLIHRKIERYIAEHGDAHIDIVGHSMGGLIGLYYVKKLGGHRRVRKLLMIGTPIHGTWMALAGIATVGLVSSSSWQLLPRSRFLDELADGDIPPGVEVHTVAAARDWVCPLPSTRLRGSHATTVPMGHSSLVVSGAVYRRLRNILRPSRSRPHVVESEPGMDSEPARTDRSTAPPRLAQV